MNLEQRLRKMKKQKDKKTYLECKAIVDKHWPAIIAKAEKVALDSGKFDRIYTLEIYSGFPEIQACDRCSIGHRYLDRRWYREGYYRPYDYESVNIYPRKGLFYRLVKLIW
jgi:hypothetical protein